MLIDIQSSFNIENYLLTVYCIFKKNSNFNNETSTSVLELKSKIASHFSPQNSEKKVIYIKFEVKILNIKSAIYILTIKKNRKPRHQLEKKI